MRGPVPRNRFRAYGALRSFVVRGPVPRIVSNRVYVGEGQALALRCVRGVSRRSARDRPSPYGVSVRFAEVGEGQALALRR